MKNKNRIGVVFSTNPDFAYETNEIQEPETLEPKAQKLKIWLDTQTKKGKKITMITGFVGKNEDLETLCKSLKNHCGTGGSTKDGEMLIQGDFCQKIIQYLQEKEYQTKNGK